MNPQINPTITDASQAVQEASLLPSELTSGRLLARNTLWSVASLAAPLLVAVVAVPILIRSIGIDRFGVLSVAWMLIGYFSLFDFGIDQGLTKMVADRLATGETRTIPALVWSSLALLLLFGIIAGGLMAILSPWIIERALKIPFSLQQESLTAFYWLSIGMPIALVTSGARGVLEATQSFHLLSAVRIPLGIFNFAGPLMVLPFSKSLIPIFAVLVLGRVIALFVHVKFMTQILPNLRESISFSYEVAKPVLHFGSWITVSNLVSPLMMNMDRFFIGSLLSIAAVSYYSAPFEAVTKLLLIPGALGTVLFPAFAMSFHADRGRMALLLERGSKYVLICIFPLTLAIVALAPDLLGQWLGSTFAGQSTGVLRWLAAGVFINCLAMLPAMLLHAVGRPDLPAKLHLLELPIYLAVIWFAVRNRGIEGAAWAWSFRIVLDALLIGLVTVRLLPETTRVFTTLLAASGVGIGLSLVVALPASFTARAVMLLVLFAFFGWLAWRILLEDVEKEYVRPKLALRWYQQILGRG